MAKVTRGRVRYWRKRYLDAIKTARAKRTEYIAAVARARFLRAKYFITRSPIDRAAYLAAKRAAWGEGGAKDRYEDAKDRREVARATYKKLKAEFYGRDKGKPRIVDLGLRCQAKWGPLGPVRAVTGHHSAGPTDRDDEHAAALFRTYHRGHADKGWGGIGYHFGIGRSGTLFLLRPVSQKGAHVGGHNTGNVGVLCHGTTGDRPTPEQAATFRWLLQNAHTSAMPRSHRVDLRGAALRGHNDWPGHTSNACPGTHKRMYLTGGKSR